MVQNIVKLFCGWEQRGEFHVFKIDNHIKDLPLFSENSVFSDKMLIIKKKNGIKGKQDLSRKDNEAVYGVVCLCNLRNTSKQAKCGGLKAHYFHIHTSACYCGCLGHWRRNESEYKNCHRCISTFPYTCWLLTKKIRFLCVGFTSSSLSRLMAKESTIIRVARQKFGNLVKAS